jgi:hypothetical protein
MLLLPLLLAAAAAAPAQDLAVPPGLSAAVASARQLAAGAPLAVKNLRAPAPAPAAAAPAAQAVVAPLNTGFQALGPAGKTGKVNGPGPFGEGDGTYDVVQNDPDQMVFDMKTGYVNGRFTMSRDPATGKDTLGFAGQTKDGPFADWVTATGNYAGQISYNSGSDSGTIQWQFEGASVTDTYSGGRAGSKSMTITLKGNSHTFTQN